MGEENEGVALAGGVALGSEESLHELRSVGYEVFEFVVDGIQGKNCVFADVRMSMFEACRICGSSDSASLAIFCRKRTLAAVIYSCGCCFPALSHKGSISGHCGSRYCIHRHRQFKANARRQ